MFFQKNNMMFACLIQWDWPRCPSPWHSPHLYPFVMLSFQCFVASSLALFQGSHVFSIFNLRIHACNKNIITTFYRLHPVWQHDSKDKCGIKLKIIEQKVNTLRPRSSFCFLLVSSHLFYLNFKRPIPSQKWILKQQVRIPLNIQKQSRKSPAHVKRPENLSRATAVFGGRVHLGPRRDQLLDHGGMAFLSRPLQRRVASGAGDATRKEQQLRLPSRNKAIVMGCFSGLLGKYFWIGHR